MSVDAGKGDSRAGKSISNALAIAISVVSVTAGAAQPPGSTISSVTLSPPELVSSTRDRCDADDVIDTSARAFRDGKNVVHLFATHYVARALVGSSLETLHKDCRIVYQSPLDKNPAHFEDHNWLSSFFTLDGTHVAALVHSEFHGWEVPSLCATPRQSQNCWWNSITSAESFDGGYRFEQADPPKNLVASLPYPYASGNKSGPTGLYQPSNIIEVDGYYYALVNAWPHELQRYGACLIRSRSVFDAGSWLAWDGASFSVRLISPYGGGGGAPSAHVCAPVLVGMAESLVRLEENGLFVVSVITPDRRFGPPGLYLFVSKDLIKWGAPKLVISVAQWSAQDAASGHWKYGYSSIIDPRSTDRNYTLITAQPYLYYVRFDTDHAPLERALMRRKLQIVFSSEAH